MEKGEEIWHIRMKKKLLNDTDNASESYIKTSQKRSITQR